MRRQIRKFVEFASKTLSIIEPIYEFGSHQVKGQEKISDLRSFFSDLKYIGADIQEGPGVDEILNLHNINLPSNSVGTVLILETLEHVEFPRKAIEEAYRILKKNGILIISSQRYFPIHNYPSDYWRFTPEGFKSLLKNFPSTFVTYNGVSLFPNIVIGIGFKSEISSNDLMRFIRKFKKNDPLKMNYTDYLMYIFPPSVWSLFRKVKKLCGKIIYR